MFCSVCLGVHDFLARSLMDNYRPPSKPTPSSSAPAAARNSLTQLGAKHPSRFMDVFQVLSLSRDLGCFWEHSEWGFWVVFGRSLCLCVFCFMGQFCFLGYCRYYLSVKVSKVFFVSTMGGLVW